MSYEKVKEWLQDQFKRIDELNQKKEKEIQKQALITPEMIHSASHSYALPDQNPDYWSKMYYPETYKQNEIKKWEAIDSQINKYDPIGEYNKFGHKSIEQDEKDKIASSLAQFGCMFCEHGINQRHPEGCDKFMFEFTYGQNTDSVLVQAVRKKFCHEWCFLKNIGKELYHARYIEPTNPYDWNCNRCGEDIPAHRLGSELVTIRRFQILDHNKGQFQVSGHLHFCIQDWESMAGRKFFK